MVAQLKPSFIFTSPSNISYCFTPAYQLVYLDIVLRDIRGKDLCYLDWLRNEASEKYLESLDFVVQFLMYVCEKNVSVLLKLPVALVLELFNIYWERVVRSPPSRDSFIKSVYFLSGGTFQNFSSFEDIPMTEFLEMINVHNNYIESLKKTNAKK